MADYRSFSNSEQNVAKPVQKFKGTDLMIRNLELGTGFRSYLGEYKKYGKN
jgi:hypothetical protein